MSLPELTKKIVSEKLDALYNKRIPEHVRHQLKLSYEITGNKVNLYEERPFFRDPNKWSKLKIAQMRYNEKSNGWTLYYLDRNEKYHEYADIEPDTDFDTIINEIDEDPAYIFWG